MPVFKIVKSDYNKKNDMKNLCNYIFDEPRHSINGMIGGSCIESSTAENVYEQMMLCKWKYQKTDGRMASHMVISFSDKEMQCLTLEQIYMIAQEFCRLFFGYQILFAIHQETDNTHIHFMINTVSFMNGMKLDISNADFRNLRQNVKHIFDRYIPHNQEQIIENSMTDELEVRYSTMELSSFVQ